MSKLCSIRSIPRAAGEWFHSSFEHFDIISMLNKRQTMENC